MLAVSRCADVLPDLFLTTDSNELPIHLSNRPPVVLALPVQPELTDQAPTAAKPKTKLQSSLVRGIIYGMIASTLGGAFLAFSRAGLTQSQLGTSEIAFLRVGVAGLVFLPWLMLNFRKCQEQVSIYDVILYLILIGPPFVVIGLSGYHYAPLVHGAVFLPGSLLIFGTAISALVLGQPVDRVKKISIAVICIGFLLIALPGFLADGAGVLIGDALFLWAGAQWSTFAILVSKRRTDPVVAVASLSVLGLLVYCPLYFYMVGIEVFASVPLSVLGLNVLIHGLLAGAIAVLSYSLCIGHLGAGPAAFFPALVPALTLMIGIPLTGEWLTVTEWIAVAIIGGGLLASVRAHEWLARLKFGRKPLAALKVEA